MNLHSMDAPHIPEYIFEVDPDGDMLLVVNYSSIIAKQSNYDAQEEKGKAKLNLIFLKLSMAYELIELCSTSNPEDQPGASQIISDLGQDVNVPEDADVSLETSLLPLADNSTANSAGKSLSTPESKPGYFAHFQVSSKHLTLASPVFKDVIQSTHTHDAPSEEHSLARLPLSDDDPDALLLLMRLMHVQFKDVPREVDLGTLAQIATLVDKYELLETTHLSADGWISGIKDSIPTELNTDLLAWMLIAEVFEDETISKQVKERAIFESKGRMDAFGFNIPGQILGMACSSRQSVDR